MRFYFNTNGFAHHRLPDLLEILKDLGYEGVSLTLDVGHADILDSAFDRGGTIEVIRRSCLEVVLETGGRYILDPWRKHRPNLLDAGADGERRLAFYILAVNFAEAIGAPIVSLWSGTLPEGVAPETARDRLCQRLDLLLNHAATRGVEIALEPEPGMLIESLADYQELATRLGGCDRLRLTCDLGHLYCTESPPYPAHLHRHAAALANVHIDDIAGRRHEHLDLGEGEIDFPPLLAALLDIGYQGPISAELSRSSHRAVDAARATIATLHDLSRAASTTFKARESLT